MNTKYFILNKTIYISLYFTKNFSYIVSPVQATAVMSETNKYRYLIQNFNNLPKNIQKIIFKNSDKELTKQICEICLNVSNGNIIIKDKDKPKFKKNKKIIDALGQKKYSIKKKANYLRQKGGAILPILASIAGPIIAALVSSKLQ